MTCRLNNAIVVAALACDCFAQSSTAIPVTPLLDQDQSSVYVKFRKAGDAPPVFNGEGKERIWLTLKNNTHWTISVLTFDLGDGYEEAEAGLMFDVEAYGGVIPESPVPNGYVLDVASLTELRAGEELLFSVPKTYLDPGLAIRVDFRFTWERNQSHTRYSAYFSYWDLPKELQDIEKEKKLKQRYGSTVGGGAEYHASPLPTELQPPLPPRLAPKQ